MGQQHRQETKRRRRTAYIKRKKQLAKNSKSITPVQLAKKVVKEEAAAEEAAKAPAKKAAAKKTPAKKAPAKKAAE